MFMLNSTQAKVLTAIFAVALATAAEAQVLIGGFQGASDPTDAGWIDTHTGQPIISDTNCSFPSGVVSGYPQSLAISVPSANAGSFGYPSLQLQFSPAQIGDFYSNSWITFTFSVPGGTYTGGYSQIYNLVLNAPGYGYNNQSWANAVEMGDTNNTAPGTDPNYYFNNGTNSTRTMVVSFNYSSVEAAIQAGISNSAATNGPSYLQMTFQGNQGGGAPISPAWYLNSVVLSQGPFGQVAEPTANVFTVDDFSTNGVGPSNPVNYDYFDSTTQEVYSVGDITNVWGNWFGGAFSNVVWNASNVNNSPSNGCMQVNLDWTTGSQWVLHHVDYSQNLNVSSLTYTSLVLDVRWDSSSVSATGTVGYASYGPLRFGVRPSGANGTTSSSQDWFYTTNIPAADTNWIHLVIPLAANDPNQVNWGELLIGADSSTTGSALNGPATLYVDNIRFIGPLVVATIPPPALTLKPAIPALRMFVGSSATYIREGLITTQGSGESESWVGAGVNYPVSYSFQLLSYPPANIGVTELGILPEASFNPTSNFQTTIYNNSFLDYQVSNGLYLAIAPNGGGSVTATVQWKVGMPSANPTNNVLVITNPTAIGTWTLTMNNPTSGSLRGPAGAFGNFTISDPNVSSDFANPAVAVFFEDPNGTAGYGLYEDWGTVSITGVASGNQIENFSQETSDFSSGTSPGGYFQNNYSVDPGNLVISRNGLDAYWFSWTQDINDNYYLVTDTNILAPPANWFSPLYYSGYNTPDETAPRGVPVQHGANWWELLTTDNLPTADGGVQQNPPAINDPLSPKAYFMLTTNTANLYPPAP